MKSVFLPFFSQPLPGQLSPRLVLGNQAGREIGQELGRLLGFAGDEE